MNRLPAGRMPSSLSCHPADRSGLPGGPLDAESDSAPATLTVQRKRWNLASLCGREREGRKPPGLRAWVRGRQAAPWDRARDGTARAAVLSGAPLPLLADPRSLLPIWARPGSPCPRERQQWHGPPLQAPPGRVKRLDADRFLAGRCACPVTSFCPVYPWSAGAPPRAGDPSPSVSEGKVGSHKPLFQTSSKTITAQAPLGLAPRSVDGPQQGTNTGWMRAPGPVGEGPLTGSKSGS